MTIRNMTRLAPFKVLLAAIAFAAVFHADAQVSGGGVTYVAPSFGNPTATVGTAAVNGSSSKSMRADAAPAINLTMSPTWTGTHTFNGATGGGTSTAGVTLGQTANRARAIYIDTTGAADGKLWDWITASSGTQLLFRLLNDAQSVSSNWLLITRSTTTVSSLQFGNATDNPTASFLGTGLVNIAGAETIGSPTGGNKGTGTLNATNLYINGAAAGFLESAVNNQATPYTAVLADSGKTLYYTAAGAPTFTIPANASVAFPVGTQITFVNDASAAVSMTIAITTDTLVLSPGGTTGSRTLAQFGVATARKVTTTRWFISGSGLTRAMQSRSLSDLLFEAPYRLGA